MVTFLLKIKEMYTVLECEKRTITLVKKYFVKVYYTTVTEYLATLHMQCNLILLNVFVSNEFQIKKLSYK